MRQAFPLWLLMLAIAIILASGCLGTSTTPIVPANASDTPVPGLSLLPTTPAALITPNASNSGVDTRTYPPHHLPYIYILCLPDAINLPEPVFIPTKLPEGYAYGGGGTDTQGFISLGISNGSNRIDFLQVSPPRPITGTLSGTSVSIISDGIKGTCTTNGSQHQLSWSDGARDYYLSGTLSCKEFLQMAGSLELLSKDTLEKVPWKELQPATPLPPSEILNLVFSREWLDSHDTNPDPQIFNVTMTADEFNSSFSPDPGDPDLLRQKEVEEGKPVAFLTMPKNMFAMFNNDPSLVKINFPDSFFRFYDNTGALHDDLRNRRAGSPGGTPGTVSPARTIPSPPPTTPRTD
jgi:hypothetical protein